MVVINNFAFKSENLGFIEVRRLMDSGPSAFLITMLVYNGSSKQTISINSDNKEEAIRIYLDVIGQVSADQGRSVSVELQTTRAELLRKTLELTPKAEDAREGKIQEDAGMQSGSDKSPPREGQPAPERGVGGAYQPYLFACLRCNSKFEQWHVGQHYCDKCVSKLTSEIEGARNETSGSKETAPGSGEDNNRDIKEGPLAGPIDPIHSV